MLFDPSSITGKPTGFLEHRTDSVLSRGAVFTSRLAATGILDLRPGEMLNIVTANRINTFSFVAVFLGSMAPILRLSLAVYRVSMATLDQLAALRESGKIRACDLLVNDNIERLKPETFARLLALDKAGTVRLWLQNSHAKVIVVFREDGAWSIMGSGNMSGNARVEQYTVVHSSELAEWNAGWIAATDLGGRRSRTR